MVAQVFRYELTFILPLAVRFPGLTRYLDLGGWLVNLARLKRTAQRIAADIDAGGYDFVLVQHERIVQSPFLLRYARTPTVYYCNEPMREFYEPRIRRPYHEPSGTVARLQHLWYGPARWVKRGVARRYDRENISRATQLLTNSFFSSESIYRAHGLRARVVYLGVDTDRFHPLNVGRQPFVLSVGAVSPLKGYDFVIEALGRLPLYRRPPLVIVGNTASQAEVRFLQECAERHGVAIEFRVNISDQELAQLYNRAQALVYAPVMEPFGLAPIEAMACGTPVVAVGEGGVRETVVNRQTGLLVGRDCKAFADALEQVLNEPALAECLATNGRRRVLEAWTWEHAYARLLSNLGLGHFPT
jgi:glycosyltransferase involved in cell wall biosynthesis